MGRLVPRWEARRYGLDFNTTRRLHYVSFADDTTLIARTKKALRKMLIDINAELAAVDLKLNADKCKVQSYPKPTTLATHMVVESMKIPIVSSKEGFAFLSTKFALSEGASVEF